MRKKSILILSTSFLFIFAYLNYQAEDDKKLLEGSLPVKIDSKKVISQIQNEHKNKSSGKISEIIANEANPYDYSDKELKAEIDYIKSIIESESIIKKINNNNLTDGEKEQVKKLFSIYDRLSLEKVGRLVKEIEEEYDDKFFSDMEESLKDLKKDIQDTKEEITLYSNS
ncbi:hypothetical protein [Vibrio caribbeanicus]|uniref:hypothetical protein n=1 Tax=Vibrio caribbeanicus TaxID=701175 RepID=UPI0030D92495